MKNASWVEIIFLFFVSNVFSQNQKIKISDDLEIQKISDHVYIYISYHDLETIKHFPANGMIYVHNGKSLLIDTPWEIDGTRKLIDWIPQHLKVSIEGVIVTHWHEDCMGGLQVFHDAGIKSYANTMTSEFAKQQGLPVPQNLFNESCVLNLGGEDVFCFFPGGGHTKDNIVVWIPNEKILFAGCIAKAMNWSSLGFIGDADIQSWPKSLNKLLLRFPECQGVIPGHGDEDPKKKTLQQ